MKKFNPDRELYKIKYGKRDKVVLSIFLLLVVISIGSTYALYQVRHSKRIIYTTVSDFSKDIKLAVYADGVKQNNFPKKTDGYIYSGIECDNTTNLKSSWDYNNWKLDLESVIPNKCSIKFVSGTDTSKANVPELYQGLIPVTIDSSGNIKVADLNSEWYNYDEHKWANAVLVTDNKYQELTNNGKLKESAKNTSLTLETDILQMYVWIPRYKYKLFNANNEVKEEQMIEIEFEEGTNTTGKTKCETDKLGKETCVYDDNGSWYTHPAFTFGSTELTGIWVGKFETTGTDSNVTILPNKVALTDKYLKEFFDISRNIETKYNLNTNEIDSHVMKNIDWGAVTYLTFSKYGRYESNGSPISDGAEVWANDVTTAVSKANKDMGPAITGCGSTSVYPTDAKWNSKACPTNQEWNHNGVHASTTNNMYGIYDMSHGSAEFIMGIMVDKNGNFDTEYTGFTTAPESKYYDLYAFGESAAENNRGHLGDATKEIKKKDTSLGGAWFNSYFGFLFNNTSTSDLGYKRIYFQRGGAIPDSIVSNAKFGITGFIGSGGPWIAGTTRMVLTAQ